MKQFKRSLLPLLTAAIVLGAVLLPGQISNWKDQSLMNRVHRENFSTDLNLPTDSLPMGERLKLYVRYLMFNDQNNMGVVVTTQRMQEEELVQANEMMRQELKAYVDNGYLDEQTYQEIADLISAHGAKQYGTRYFLQDEETRRFARIVVLEDLNSTSDLHLWIHMDEETGRILSFECTIPKLQMDRTTTEFGEFFLSRLGVSYECTFENKAYNYAEMILPGLELGYTFDFSGVEWGYIACRPFISQEDMPEVDEELINT